MWPRIMARAGPELRPCWPVLVAICTQRLRFGVLWGGGICTMKFDKIIFRGRPLGDYFAVTTLLQHSPLPEASELHDTV